MTIPAVIVRIAILMLVCMHSSLAQFDDLKIDKVSAGHQFTEGPVWSGEGNYLLFSDVPSNKIFRLIPGKGTSVYRENSNGASGNGIDQHGALWTCETRTRRLVREGKNGAVEVVLDKWDAKPLNAPNDLVIRKDGHAWFTDPAFGAQSDKKQLDFYGVYHVPPKGAPELAMRWKTRPNGLALSPNGKILYIADSDGRHIRAYDLDNKGIVSKERLFIDQIPGIPDGLKVDEKGNVYVTAAELFIYSPQGKLLRSIKIPETPRNLAFGDPDLQTLYITAYSSVYRIRMPFKGAQP